MATKVIFDGDTKRIIVKPGTTFIDVKTELYSDWKEWALYTGSQYLPAFRVAGGDPLPGGQFVGGFYFFINNWKLMPSGSLADADLIIDGNLFADDGSSVMITSGTSIQLVKQTVSSLALINNVDTGTGLTAVQESQLSATYVATGQTTSSLSLLSGSVAIVSGGVSAIHTSMSVVSGGIATVNASMSIVSGGISTVQQTINASGGSLTPTQATMLLEMYNLLGLDPTKPLVVSPVARVISTDISQSISRTGNVVTITRT